MTHPNRKTVAAMLATFVGLLACAQPLAAGVAGAAPVAPAATGILVGSVGCGAAGSYSAGNVVVAVEGTSLSTRTDAHGAFALAGVPAGTSFTINFLADPQGAVGQSRQNVVVQPGATLDIGGLDLAVCPPSEPSPVWDPDQSTTNES
jgi:hypothetical protein